MHAGPAILRRHRVEESNVELLASLRTNIVASQEAVLEAGWTAAAATNGASAPATNGAPPRPPLATWTTAREDGAIYLPSVDWSQSGVAEERSQYDITVKLFFLPHVSPARRCQHMKEAVELVLKELHVPSIDLLILAFPNVAFSVKDEADYKPSRGGCDGNGNGNGSASASANGSANGSRPPPPPSSRDEAGDVEDIGTMVKTWWTAEKLHAQGVVAKLGVADFSSRRLDEFLKHTRVRPSVNQINVRDCCTVPRSLIAFAKKERVELLTHNDCVNILPADALRRLLGEGRDGVGILAGAGAGASKNGNGGGGDLAGKVEPQWVVKYTAVVKNRGVVENKGYFTAADVEDVV
jgi:glutamate--cysteine ligase regulatory subunit